MLATEAGVHLRGPADLVDLATMMGPKAGAAVAMGFLKQNGDVYEMDAAYRKGLLTINGAPLAIPLPSVQ